MRISKLSERAGLPVGTVKFYLRTGLLHSGLATSATQALYDESHLARLRLIRAMLEVGRLSLADIQRILDAVDLPGDEPDARAALVQAAVARASEAAEQVPPSSDSASGPSVDDVAREAATLLRGLGWQIDPGSPHLPGLARAVRAARSVGLPVERARLTAYAEAAAHVARSDQSSLDAVPEAERPTSLAASLVLMDPIFAALRHLAGEHQAAIAKGKVPGPRLPVGNA